MTTLPQAHHIRIAIPVADGRLHSHFGDCHEFVFVDADPQELTVLATRNITAPPHQPGLFPRWLREQGVRVVIVGGIGQRALDNFARHGIVAITGEVNAHVEPLIATYLAGLLTGSPVGCDQPGHRQPDCRQQCQSEPPIDPAPPKPPTAAGLETLAQAWAQREGPAVLATVNAAQQPNAIYVGEIRYVPGEGFIVADNYFSKTRANLQHGTRGAILFLTQERKSYQVNGPLTYHTEGPIFANMQSWHDPKHPGVAAVLLRIEAAYSGAKSLFQPAGGPP